MFKAQLELLDKAIKAVPAVKYALGVVGVGAATGIIYGLFKAPEEAVVWIFIMLILMVLLLVFARIAALKHKATNSIAIFTVWCILLLFMISCLLVFSSLFFDWPKPAQQIFSRSSDNLPELIKNCTEGRPAKDCYAELRGSASQLFEKGCLVAKFDENLLIAIITNTDGTISWFKTKENFQKGVPAICTGPNDSLLRLGFRWWYCSEMFNTIRPGLGKPISKETKAWVQYQEWTEGLLFFGIPHTAMDYERDHFQRLLGGFLTGYKENNSGQGKFFTISDGNVNNPYCTAYWFPARSDGKMTEKQKLQDCKTLKGPDLYTKGAKICDFGN